jgi:multidrug efflux pump subunit AcrB
MAVIAAMILIMGILSLGSMLIDIFPVIDIPVVAVVWNYDGLSAEDMERRIVLVSERSVSTTVNGVSRIESESTPGVGLLRIYFEPGTELGGAIAQIGAVSETALRAMPPGLSPPNIIQFNASNVPVSQLTMRSDTLSENEIADYALNFIRQKLFTIPGLVTPAPYGGRTRQVSVDVNPHLAAARGLSVSAITNALQLSNLILPAGTARVGDLEYNILLNSSPDTIKEFEKIPLKVAGPMVVTLGDVARVSDGYADQTSIVRVNGKRASYLSILKKADASTLTVVDLLKEALASIREVAPKGLHIDLDFDQSKFVDEATKSVVHEALISSFLVSLMVLFFLGSWRSVIVICTSIPLSILVGIVGLDLTGNSINIMTLGGLSLAIGMLVDDATVEVENVHRNRGEGHPLTVAILRGAEQIALPAIMATLAICIVFFPVVLLHGPAKFLFTPMAQSVVFSMLASYVLSRTLVPVLCKMLLAHEHHDVPGQPPHPKSAYNQWREGLFEKLQNGYTTLAEAVMANRPFVLGVFGVVLLLSGVIPFIIGTDFFPVTDTGLMKIHFRARPGLRIERTEDLITKAENEIRHIVPEDELGTINSMLGVPDPWNLAFVPTDNIAGMDAEILIALKPNHKPTIGYAKAIRSRLKALFPGCQLYFQPADIISQVLSFGLSAPIDVEIESNDFNKSFAVARELKEKFQKIPGAVDVNIKQGFDYPTLKLNVDRERAIRMGFSQRDIANSMLFSLSSNNLLSPSYFVNPSNNVNYYVAVKVPLPRLASVQELLLTPITPDDVLLNSPGRTGPRASLMPATDLSMTLGNLTTVDNRVSLESISHTNVQRVLDVTANVEERDLGGVLRDINKAIAQLGPLPPTMAIKIRGQGEVMDEAFTSLGMGLVLAIILVFLLMVILFQSWLDPFIVLMAVPGALLGILWTLLLTGTTINVVSFMGSIMAVGIASANAILLVSFANDVRLERPLTALQAALEAGKTRLRPVLMTALAMIIGMIPTALGLGEGGEQNAPLGRAVIGGLLAATVVTLFIIPVIYSYLRKELPTKAVLEARFAAESEGKVYEPSGPFAGAPA